MTGSIINVFTVMMNNLLTAQGATKFTMIAMLTGSIANVILDPVMIYGMDLGIEGAAVATVISLCINMALYIGYIAKKKGVLRISVKNIAPSKTIYTEVLKIGIPVLLFQLLASRRYGKHQYRIKALWRLCGCGYGSSHPYYDSCDLCRFWVFERFPAVCRIQLWGRAV